MRLTFELHWELQNIIRLPGKLIHKSVAFDECSISLAIPNIEAKSSDFDTWSYKVSSLFVKKKTRRPW